MAGIVRLKHVTRRNDWLFYHYSGFVNVTGGVIELPADNFTLIKRAFGLGFTLTEDGQPIRAKQFSDIVAQATPTDSLEEQDEDSNSGRQSSTTDRVRESESAGSGSTPKRRSRSSVSSGAGAPRESTSTSTGDDE